MAAQGSTVQPPQRLTLLGQLLSLPGRILGLLLVSLLCSLLMEYAGMLWFWPEQGWRHSQAMLHAELGWLGEQFQRSLLLENPEASTRSALDWLNAALFERTGLLDYASQARARSQERSLTSLLAQLYLLIEDFVLASLFVTLTFAVRLIILTLALPLFALAMALDPLLGAAGEPQSAVDPTAVCRPTRGGRGDHGGDVQEVFVSGYQQTGSC